MAKIKYIPRQIINNLMFIEEVESHIQSCGKKVRRAKFRCKCGKDFETTIKSVKYRETSSCGCYKIERLTKHNLSYHSLYKLWISIKSRCYNKNVKCWGSYGGRGIKVCGEWLNNFKSFYDWAIKNGWRKGLTIDREENDGDYTPDNCRFITRAENSRNTRQTKLVWNDVSEIRNIKLLIPKITLREIAKAYSVSRVTIWEVLKNKTWRYL